MREAEAAALRRLYPRVVAKVLAATRSLPDAEDAVHDAITRALESWREGGLPDAPEAWLLTTAANAYRDRLRRRKREQLHGDALEMLAQMSPWARVAVGDPDIARGWKDELLRLIFACCHPALAPGESAALALATVLGLSTTEIAGAFVVPPRSMEQRLTRARRRLRESGDAEGARRPGDARDRLDAVLRTVHLLFNEGYWSTDGRSPIRAELCRLAVGLARSVHEAFPRDPEAAGLLALLLLHDARRDARLRGAIPVPLPDQDRSRWDRDAIASATGLLERALAAGAPGPFQIEAAIAAVHARAAAADETDWREIASLYALLEPFRPTPAVRVNRAFAVGRAQGPAAGLALLEPGGAIDVGGYPYVHLVRGALLEELGDTEEARSCLERAVGSARNAEERAQVQARLDRLDLQPAGRAR